MVSVWVKDSSGARDDGNATESTAVGDDVNPFKKVTLISDFDSNDPLNTLEWSVASSAGLTLEYGVTTSTSTVDNYLVIKPGVLRQGLTYAFTLVVTNSLGRAGFTTLNITAARAPWGGHMAVEPANGTTLMTNFELSTDLWTDDAESLPLSYAFFYLMADGTDSQIGFESANTSVVSTLALGSSPSHALTLCVDACDVLAVCSRANTTATVAPPSSVEEAVSIMEDEASTISDLTASGSRRLTASGESSSAMRDAMHRIQACASLLAAVSNIGDGDDGTTGGGGGGNASKAVQSSLLGHVESIAGAQTGATATDELQSHAHCTRLLAATGKSSSSLTFSASERERLLLMVHHTANSSASRGEVPTATLTSSVTTLSTLLGYGMLDQRGLNATQMVMDALSKFSDAVAADLVAGEDQVNTVTDYIGHSTQVLSVDSVSSAIYPAQAAMSDAGLRSNCQPSFKLPAGTTGTLVTTTMALNPYYGGDGMGEERAGGANNRSVTRIMIDGETDTVLAEPMILVVPVVTPSWAPTSVGHHSPSSSTYRRQLLGSGARSNGTTTWAPTPAPSEVQVHTLNCSNLTVVWGSHNSYSEMDVERSAFCHTELPGLSSPPPASERVWCSAIQEHYDLNCSANASANGAPAPQVVELTCPTRYAEGVCQYWDPRSEAWNSSGCVYDSYDEIESFVVCNCSRLGSFSADVDDALFTEQAYENFGAYFSQARVRWACPPHLPDPHLLQPSASFLPYHASHPAFSTSPPADGEELAELRDLAHAARAVARLVRALPEGQVVAPPRLDRQPVGRVRHQQPAGHPRSCVGGQISIAPGRLSPGGAERVGAQGPKLGFA